MAKLSESVWRSVDWSKGNRVIAAQLGVTHGAVHWQRHKRGIATVPVPTKVRLPLSKSDILPYIAVDATTGCWVWQRSRNRGGYGLARRRLAHRVSFSVFRHDPPPGLLVCHECDNRPCVNPEHLFLGTYVDNMQDASRKGRMAKRLTPEIVREIRDLAASMPQKQVAVRLGLSKQLVHTIVKHKVWRFV